MPEFSSTVLPALSPYHMNVRHKTVKSCYAKEAHTTPSLFISTGSKRFRKKPRTFPRLVMALLVFLRKSLDIYGLASHLKSVK